MTKTLKTDHDWEKRYLEWGLYGFNVKYKISTMKLHTRECCCKLINNEWTLVEAIDKMP